MLSGLLEHFILNRFLLFFFLFFLLVVFFVFFAATLGLSPKSGCACGFFFVFFDVCELGFAGQFANDGDDQPGKKEQDEDQGADGEGVTSRVGFF